MKYLPQTLNADIPAVESVCMEYRQASRRLCGWTGRPQAAGLVRLVMHLAPSRAYFIRENQTA